MSKYMFGDINNLPPNQDGLDRKENKDKDSAANQELRQLREELLATKKALAEERDRYRISGDRQKQEYYQAVFEQIYDGIVLVDVKTHSIVEANSAYCKLVNYSKEELLNLKIEDLVAVNYRSLTRQIQQHLNRGDYYINESKLRCSDGEIIDIELSVSLIEFHKKKLFCSVVRNISARKEAENSLTQTLNDLEIQVSERGAQLLKTNRQLINQIVERQRAQKAVQDSDIKYRTLVENLKEVIFQTDIYGKLIFLNPAWVEVTGFSISESIGKHFLFGIHSDDNQRNADLFQAVVSRKKEQYRNEIRYLTKEGNYRWFEIWIRLALDSNARPIGMCGTLNDITDRKEAELEVCHALQQERDLNELKSRFITTASHEFRTPLATIFSSTDILKMFWGNLSETKKLAHLDKIQDQVHKMTRLMEDVLLLNKVESGSLLIKPILLNLEEFCKEIVHNIKHTSSYRHEFIFTFMQRCNTQECSLFKVDSKLIAKILTNLLFNAVKYSPNGGTVQLKVIAEDEQIVFQIKDEGIGIPPADVPYLFERFYRGSNVGNIGGTGLGLAIIKKAVDLQGGKVTVDSQMGMGTCFTISIPAKHQE